MPLARYTAVASGFTRAALSLSGGAPVVNVVIDSETYVCTVDTGAPGPICLGAKASKRLRRCKPTSTSITQYGVNNEAICSNIVSADVSLLGSIHVKDAALFLNDTPVDHTDGYIGLGFLRAFDLL